MRPDAVLYENGFVRMPVRGTDEVRIEPVGDVPASVVAHHAYGLGARILLLHAGFFSLHASVVDTPTGVVAIGGASGAGKSTTSVASAASRLPPAHRRRGSVRVEARY